MTKTNGSAETEYLAAVKEGLAITADVTSKQWLLGDLADTVTKVYGENRIKRFAEDIKFAGNWCTLERYRTVCRAFPKSRGRPRFFGVAQVLAKLPEQERFATAQGNPGISVSDARALVTKWNEENPDAATEAEQPEQKDDFEEDAGGPTPSAPAKANGAKKTANVAQPNEWLKDTKGWINKCIVQANAATDELNAAMNCAPELRRRLNLTMEPLLVVGAFEKAAKTYLAFIAWHKESLAEASDTAVREGRVKTAPRKRVPEPSEA